MIKKDIFFGKFNIGIFKKKKIFYFSNLIEEKKIDK